MVWLNHFSIWHRKHPQHALNLCKTYRDYTANILTVLSTAFGSVTFPTVIWLYMLQPKTGFDLKLYSSMSLSVLGTAVDCDNHCQITVGNITQPMTVNLM